MENGIKINFFELEHLDKPGYLETVKAEKKCLQECSKQVFEAPPGDYRQPSALHDYKTTEVCLCQQFVFVDRIPKELFVCPQTSKLNKDLGINSFQPSNARSGVSLLFALSSTQIPKAWRPELQMEEEVMKTQPNLREDLQLQQLVREHLDKIKSDRRIDSSSPIPAKQTA